VKIYYCYTSIVTYFSTFVKYYIDYFMMLISCFLVYISCVLAARLEMFKDVIDEKESMRVVRIDHRIP